MPIERPGFPALSVQSAGIPADVSRVVTSLQQGGLNNVIDVEIEETGTFLTIHDTRINGLSWVGIMQMDPTPQFYVSDTRDFELDLSWVGAGWGSRTLRLLVVG